MKGPVVKTTGLSGMQYKRLTLQTG